METVVYVVVIIVALAVALAAALLFAKIRREKTKAQGNDKREDAKAPVSEPETENCDEDGSAETMLLMDYEEGDWSDKEHPWRVLLVDTERLNMRFEVPVYEAVSIGFLPSSDICINYDHSVSRHHCDIIRRGSEFFLIDCGSSNGKRVNDVNAINEVPLRDGDVINLGRVKLRFEIL